jgi:hypothetical protein
MGPWAGWIGGWAIVVADIIVMANLAQIAGLGLGLMLFGVVLMFWWWGAGHREFFRRRPEVAERGALEAPPPQMAETAGVA